MVHEASHPGSPAALQIYIIHVPSRTKARNQLTNFSLQTTVRTVVTIFTLPTGVHLHVHVGILAIKPHMYTTS